MIFFKEFDLKSIKRRQKKKVSKEFMGMANVTIKMMMKSNFDMISKLMNWQKTDGLMN